MASPPSCEGRTNTEGEVDFNHDIDFSLSPQCSLHFNTVTGCGLLAGQRAKIHFEKFILWQIVNQNNVDGVRPHSSLRMEPYIVDYLLSSSPSHFMVLEQMISSSFPTSSRLGRSACRPVAAFARRRE